MTHQNPGIELRLHLVKANRSAIHLMLCRFASGGHPVGDAVVVVADTSDPVGFELGVDAAEKARLDLHKESTQIQDRGEIPTALLILTIDDARSLFVLSHPSVAIGLERQPPPGCVRVVSIAAGAAMLVHSHMRLITSIGEA